MFILSGICMQLVFIGESVKTIDNKTNHSYLIKYTDIPWTAIMGLRDIIAHEYHRIDEEEIFAVVNKDLISLLKIEVIKLFPELIECMMQDNTLSKGKVFTLDKFDMSADQEAFGINVNCRVCAN